MISPEIRTWENQSGAGVVFGRWSLGARAEYGEWQERAVKHYLVSFRCGQAPVGSLRSPGECAAGGPLWVEATVFIPSALIPWWWRVAPRSINSPMSELLACKLNELLVSEKSQGKREEGVADSWDRTWLASSDCASPEIRCAKAVGKSHHICFT